MSFVDDARWAQFISSRVVGDAMIPEWNALNLHIVFSSNSPRTVKSCRTFFSSRTSSAPLAFRKVRCRRASRASTSSSGVRKNPALLSTSLKQDYDRCEMPWSESCVRACVRVIMTGRLLKAFGSTLGECVGHLNAHLFFTVLITDHQYTVYIIFTLAHDGWTVTFGVQNRGS